MKSCQTCACIFLLAASDARAEDEVMQRFTQSMRALYETSVLCEQALSPSPAGYAQAINNYVQVYYADVDSNYWVLPKVTRRAKNSAYCSTRLQQGLLSYEYARNDFAENYENYPQPPRLAMVNESAVRTTVTVRRVTPKPYAPDRFKAASGKIASIY
jgi:hypothetical protein